MHAIIKASKGCTSVTVQTQEAKLAKTKKEFGIFYTPSELTKILCDWAVRTLEDRVLEPSFGGCSFLDAIRRIFERLGNKDYIGQLGGCDTDENAFDYLVKSLDVSKPPRQFKLLDFLATKPDDFEDLFDAIVGNPPYVSHHNMTQAQIKLGQKILEEQDRSLSKRASLWGYFVLHSLSFLKQGGRIAFILPGSFVNTQYASQIRSYLQQGFQRSLVLKIGERVFLGEGTSEVAIVVLCEGWQVYDEKQDMQLEFVSTLEEVEPFITGWSNNEISGTTYEGRANFSLLSPAALQAYLSLAQNEHCYQFTDFARVLIGMVTGDNNFFVINKETAEAQELPEQSLRFVMAKYKDLSGLNLTTDDLIKLRDSNKKCLLFDTSCLVGEHPSVKRLLASYPANKRENNKTFGRRARWDQPDDRRIPDAFFTYMNNDGPEMCLNWARVNCTNTVHRVFFQEGVDITKQKLLVISLLTSFSQLSAEIESRSYGSGVLKHEPSEIKRFRFYIPDGLDNNDIDLKFNEIDLLLRKGSKDEAQRVADKFILSDLPNMRKVINILQEALTAARERRIPQHKRQ